MSNLSADGGTATWWLQEQGPGEAVTTISSISMSISYEYIPLSK